MTKYNHLLTISFSAISSNPSQPTVNEALAGLLGRVTELAAMSEDEQAEILTGDVYDTVEEPDA